MKAITSVILTFFSVTFIILQSCNSKNQRDIVAENFNFASQQLLYAVELAEEMMINNQGDSLGLASKPLVSPRTMEKDGSLVMVPAEDWTSGFFPGELWYMYEYFKDSKWEELAVQFTTPLEKQKENKGTHDLGFMIFDSFGHGLRLSKKTNYSDIIMEAAHSLASRYKPNAKIIRSWDFNKETWQCPVIIDNMMNLELLFWAFKESGDSTFYNIATNHAITTMNNHFRDDYGTWHVIDYDTITGNVLNRHTYQGYQDESTWSRGQAWALYGFTMVFRETKNEAFLALARNIADFIFTHPNLPEDFIPYWDFNASGIPNEPRDVSAATVIASSLYELSTWGGDQSKLYKEWADSILVNLTDNYRATLNADAGFLLLHSTGAKSLNSEIDVPLVYADYYFLEALLRKSKLENNQPLF